MKRLPLLLASLGILLRIVPIWAQPLWYDENFSVLLARLNLDRLIAATAGDVHPPLWYLICWPLAHIPFLPAWAVVRIPALLAGIVAIWIWWLVLEEMKCDRRVKLVAFGLFCFLPQQVYYAQEGRMYALLTLLVLSAWLCILRRRWIWLAVVTALMLWLQNYGLIYAAALWLAALIHDRRAWKPLTVALAAAGLTFIPWVLVLLSQVDIIGAGYWIMRFSFPSILSDFSQAYFSHGLLDADIVNFAVFYGILIWVLIWSLRRRTLDLRIAVLAFVPIMLAALVSIIWRPIVLSRALIPAGAFICLLLAQPVEFLGRKPLLLASVFLIPTLFVNLLSIELRSHWADDAIVNDNAAINLIDSHWQEGDLLYYINDGVFVSGAVIWKNIDNAMRVEPCGLDRGSLSPATRAALGMRVGPLPENVTGRTWVINTETPLNPSCENDYMLEHGLLDGSPLFCPQDSALVKSCVYVVEP